MRCNWTNQICRISAYTSLLKAISPHLILEIPDAFSGSSEPQSGDVWLMQ